MDNLLLNLSGCRLYRAFKEIIKYLIVKIYRSVSMDMFSDVKIMEVVRS